MWQNDGKKDVCSWKRTVRRGGGSIMHEHGCQWNWLTVDALTADGSSRTNSEVYSDILSAGIEPNAAK